MLRANFPQFPDGTQKAMAHTAISLTPAGQNYGQIEKEALAIIFAIKKLHNIHKFMDINLH